MRAARSGAHGACPEPARARPLREVRSGRLHRYFYMLFSVSTMVLVVGDLVESRRSSPAPVGDALAHEVALLLEDGLARGERGVASANSCMYSMSASMETFAPRMHLMNFTRARSVSS